MTDQELMWMAKDKAKKFILSHKRDLDAMINEAVDDFMHDLRAGIEEIFEEAIKDTIKQVSERRSTTTLEAVTSFTSEPADTSNSPIDS